MRNFGHTHCVTRNPTITNWRRFAPRKHAPHSKCDHVGTGGLLSALARRPAGTDDWQGASTATSREPLTPPITGRATHMRVGPLSRLASCPEASHALNHCHRQPGGTAEQARQASARLRRPGRARARAEGQVPDAGVRQGHRRVVISAMVYHHATHHRHARIERLGDARGSNPSSTPPHPLKPYRDLDPPRPGGRGVRHQQGLPSSCQAGGEDNCSSSRATTSGTRSQAPTRTPSTRTTSTLGLITLVVSWGHLRVLLVVIRGHLHTISSRSGSSSGVSRHTIS